MNYGIAFAFMALLCFIVDWLASYGKVRTKWQSFITNFFLALPAFFATPNTEHYFDITRFSLLMEDIRSINNLSGKFGGLEWSLHSSEYSQEPFVAIYVWIFSLFKNNGFLFFVSTFIFLMALAWFISQAGRFYHISVFHQILVKYTILGLFNIVYEVAGVRNFLAFMVFCAAFFYDISHKSFNGKWLCWVLYFFCMMLHPATIMLVLLRILAGLSDQLKYSTIFDIFIILILLFYSKLISLTLQILSLLSSVPFVNFLLLKGQYYLYGQSNYQSFAGTREIIGISLILLDQVVEFIFFLHLSRCNLVKGYSVFYVFVMTLVLGSILNTQIYT